MGEITHPVALCDDRGMLNPAAIGWSRRPVHSTALPGWGRRKRWEYWGIMTPAVFIGATISSLDYAGAHSIYILDRRSGLATVCATVEPLARSARFPDGCGVGVTRADDGGFALEFANGAAGTALSVTAPGITLHAEVGAPEQDCLAVVVPWSRRRFQYTVKAVGRPVVGELRLGRQRIPIGGDGSFAVLDFGRGKWPYSITWNWAAGFGVTQGRRVGVQLGGRWTDGTGNTENGLFLDGRLHKIGEDLQWSYDPARWSAPWRITGSRVDVTLTPSHVRADRTDLVAVASDIHQCFGTFAGWVADDAGNRVSVDGLVGWAEEARNRW